jgi:choline/glycine/proline betaine transport protein
VSGGLGALQTATIASAFPFAIILLFVTASLIKSLRIDLIKRQTIGQNSVNGTLVNLNSAQVHWHERLDTIAQLPKAKAVEQFIETTVQDALNQVAERMKKLGFDSTVETRRGSCSISVGHGPEIDFLYVVKLRCLDRPDFGGVHRHTKNNDQSDVYFRADVYLREGGQDYDLMGFSKEAIINDVIDQYERHRQFLDIIR